jgi:hypothetical protein
VLAARGHLILLVGGDIDLLQTAMTTRLREVAEAL